MNSTRETLGCPALIPECQIALLSPIAEYRISTITVVGSLNGHFNVDLLYSKFLETSTIQHVRFDLAKDTWCELPTLIYIEYGKDKFDCQFKGDPSYRKTSKQNVHKRRFDHQSTLLFRYRDYLVNMKLFTTGTIQMTGVRDIEHGRDVINILLQIIEETTEQKLSLITYKVCLINCDFKLPFEIRRDTLHDIFNKYYKTKCSYEPCIYPGVKLKYFSKPGNVQGVCVCKPHCLTKRNGTQACCKISISFFQSGCIIITGARSNEQIQEVYHHIYDVLTTHYKSVIMTNPLYEIESRVQYTGNIHKIKLLSI